MIVSRFLIIGRSQRQSGKGEIIEQDQNRDGIYKPKTHVQWKTHYGPYRSNTGFKPHQGVLSATSIPNLIFLVLARELK